MAVESTAYQLLGGADVVAGAVVVGAVVVGAVVTGAVVVGAVVVGTGAELELPALALHAELPSDVAHISVLPAA
jgi:hypothetical protein